MRYYCAAQSVIRQAADTFATGRFGGSEFRRGADFVAQQKMLPCATNDAVLRNKGVGGCARRLAGHRKLQGKKCAPLGREVRTSWSSSAHLSREKCVLVVELLFNRR
jgi:hypothetical protein